MPRERPSSGIYTTRTQGQGTGNRISVDPHVPELAVDLTWQ